MTSSFDGQEVFLQPAVRSEDRGAPPFAQGVVQEWNALAGTNKVRVRGQVLENLLSLVGSEGGLIRPGDVVAVIYYQDTAAVLGRIDAPGVEQRALGIHAARASGAVVSLTDTFDDLGGPSVNVYIGSSRRCTVIVSAFIGGFDCIGFAGVLVSGASSISPTESRSVAAGWGAAASGTAWVNASRTFVLTSADGLNEGDNTFSLRYKTSAGVSGNAQFSERELLVQPF